MSATVVAAALVWALFVLAVIATAGIWWAICSGPVFAVVLWFEVRDLTRGTRP